MSHPELLPGQPVVDVQNLHVRFGPDGPPVVRDISFRLHAGECLALVGESGSGKSVTARALVGLAGYRSQVKADRLQVYGENLLQFGERQWRRMRGDRVGFITQDALSSLDPLYPVGREIGEPLRLHRDLSRTQRHDRVLELLRAVGVPEPELRTRQYPFQLSGGLRQRALIASAIACDPTFLIADEPTTALDAVIQAQIINLLDSFRSRNMALLVISHDLAVVSRLANRVAVMYRGQIVEQGPMETVLHDPQHPYTQLLIRAASAVHGQTRPASRSRSISAANLKDDGPILRIEALSKTFISHDAPPRKAVSSVSFSVNRGETLGVVGESGSGKTTLIRMVLGLEKPDGGSVFFRERAWQALTAEQKRQERRRLQVIFQDPLSSFDPRYTVEKVIGEALAIAGYTDAARRRARAIELLEIVRLDASFLRRRPVELSGGQCQRVAIARALAPEPEILVCDEPVSALDVSVQVQILALLEDLKARLGLTCIFISHDLGIIHRICDHVLVMKDGAVAEAGTVHSVFAHPQHAYTRELLQAIPRFETRPQLEEVCA
jgi:peptide/nickel transport system ATP-binding protein